MPPSTRSWGTPIYEIPAFSLVTDWELGLCLVLGIFAKSGSIFWALAQSLAATVRCQAGRIETQGIQLGALDVEAIWGRWLQRGEPSRRLGREPGPDLPGGAEDATPQRPPATDSIRERRWPYRAGR